VTMLEARRQNIKPHPKPLRQRLVLTTIVYHRIIQHENISRPQEPVADRINAEDNGCRKAGVLRPPTLTLYFSWMKDPAVGAQLINDFAYELSTDLALPSDGGNCSRGILLEAAMICRCNLELLLVAVRGTTDVNTTIRVLLRPMPCNNVVDAGHLIDGGENGVK
jgi:hypothetical protein